jgi:hypothetical protein
MVRLGAVVAANEDAVVLLELLLVLLLLLVGIGRLITFTDGTCSMVSRPKTKQVQVKRL